MPSPKIPARPIVLRGCRQHELKGFDLSLPRGRYCVVTGPSGSGKSSLAFDTLFAEGQRRYVESFSAYARQFLERMNRPALDGLEGIPPAVAIEQGNTVRSSRSTVGTVTEINDFVKLLYARASVRHCDRCDAPVLRRDPGSVAEELLERPAGTRLLVGFDAPDLSGEDSAEVRRELQRQGFTRLLHGGELLRADELEGPLPGRTLVALDRVALGPEQRQRLVDSLEQAFAHGDGRAAVVELGADGAPFGEAEHFELALRCDACGLEHPEPTPGHFTFNNPLGACPECRGFGRSIEIGPDLVVPDPRKSLAGGAIKPWTTEKTRQERRALREACDAQGIPMDLPWSELDEEQRAWIWHGEEGSSRRRGWWGVQGWFDWLETKQYKMHVRVLLSRYRTYVRCTACDGTRFRPEVLKHRLAGRNVAELQALPIGACREFFDELALPPSLAEATAPVLEEVRARLRYLCEVGLDYLTLDRQSRTLSGGEMQRVNLTTAVGSSLTGALFVLDEPSVGLHPRDNDRLAGVLSRLVAQGNTAVVVEHDPALIRAAEWLIDMGPAAGEGGGRVLYEGPVEGVSRVEESATGMYLGGVLRIPLPEGRREPGEDWLVVRQARAHELKGFDARFPVGLLTCVTGVSGAGKSSLVEDVLYRNLLRARGQGVEEPGACDGVEGAELFEDLVFVDSSPIGKSPKSTVGTYLKVHDRIRKLLAATEEAAEAGVDAGWFSFNRPGGRCETCEGAGFEKVEMQFLADVHVPCADCGGERFRPEALAVRIGGRNIAEVLRLSLDEAAEVFAGDAQLVARLAAAREVGLGYLKLGQSVVALSGGEAQRLKLAAAVAATQARATRRRRRKGNLYLFDEPSTGLAACDLAPLLRAFDLLVEAGHTLIVVEHSGEVIKRADWVIDLGPEAGAQGGEVVAEGTPEAIAACAGSLTGRYLSPLLEEGASEAEVAAAQAPAPRAGEEVHDGTTIRVHGANEHNLKHVDLELDQGRLVVVTGPSGSGKSSLAFDVLFAEGQRRYLETLSPYARQFLSPVAKPAVDRVDGLPPAIAIEQRRTRGGSKTTVATLTEVWHYLRLLWSKLGVPHCPACDQALETGTPAQVAAAIAQRHGGKRVRLLAPVVRGRKGFHREVFEKLAAQGVTHARVDGKRVKTSPTPKLSRYQEHDVDAELSSLVAPERATKTLEALVDDALERGGGTLRVVAGAQESAFSSALRCPSCGTGVPEPEPRSFSFNGARGWCPECEGYGFLEDFDEQLLVPDPTLSIRAGALAVLDGEPFAKKARARFAKQVEEELGVDADRPWGRLGKRAREQVLHGTDDFTGLVERLHHFLEDDEAVTVLSRFLAPVECEDCGGGRLAPGPSAVRVDGLRLPELARRSVEDARARLEELSFEGLAAAVWEPIRRELLPKLEFLEQVGLGYLSLDRRGDTLSGGEAQRIRLAASLGSHLTGVLYVLDEPTIGLHPSDGDRLIRTLKDLRDLGNTVVVVEHDEDTIAEADWLVDLGPGAGVHGGEIVEQGPPKRLAESGRSSTARSLRGEGRGRRNERPAPRENGPWLEIQRVSENNLQELTARFPLGALSCVTGVSGSGKSTLVREVLLPALRRRLHASSVRAGAHRGLVGWQAVQRVAEVDQTPIGRNPRSTPATYTGIWDHVRKLFAAAAESKARGYTPSRFSFNVRGGRCEKCEGQGLLKVEMSFLPDARVACDACGGKRFNADTLEIRWRGRTIAEVLDMSIEEAVEFFDAHPQVREPLAMALRTGLGYLTLGQPSPTLSGGEAQRIKLVEELGRPTQSPTLFVLDEPTTGLSLSDVSSLIDVFHLLVEKGHSLVVIEHHLDVIAESDWVIDLGPGGGVHGGRIVAEGPPTALKPRKGERSETARCLRDWLNRWSATAGAG